MTKHGKKKLRLMNPLTWHRAKTITNRKKQENKQACRGQIQKANHE